MLSILIPCYNFDVRKLVYQLHDQGSGLSIPFEILCVEDASSAQFVQLNQELQQLPFVRYQVLKQNMGRSKIRNYLATQARYNYLLFMDCDAMPVDAHYLQNYTQHLAPNQLLYGGRCYQNTPPNDPLLYFHWFYGLNREQSTAATRQQLPYRSFMTNNFLIPKPIFEEIRFEETLTQYGHEDTLFGLALKKRQIPILHLDNPLKHIGIEINHVFIKKSEQAIQNLHFLYSNHHLDADIKLLTFFIRTKKLYLHKVILMLYCFFKSKILNNLYSNHPQLKLFDFYKLGYLIHWHQQQKD
ncbi:glycosyltransferase family 2 protein [Aureispira anguillae]|uniref:Glycosyltransferase family 2 protein n=1 Tax=Aureispira anguillae TaxID=2864201 RepID=A0A915YEN5_9BACT|nr:glycosyltransferase family 2 protein [Aureispira anguillae]BDS11647.1 glycosyltransferase family 2 protein [Aureispira anguillae]